MNAVDLPIVVTVALLALLGLKTGLLKPISGIGGLVIGVFVAIQQSAELAASLEQYIEGDNARRIAAFVAIVIITVVVSRIAAFLIKKLLTTLVLGWLDHVAGAVAGAVAGTPTGANIAALASSRSTKMAPAVLNIVGCRLCQSMSRGGGNVDLSTDRSEHRFHPRRSGKFQVGAGGLR